jgi:hypothetical protein
VRSTTARRPLIGSNTFTGAGLTVSKIRVPVQGGEFRACIDSVTASGLPGDEIVCASAIPNGALTTVRIKPTLLKAGKKYFLEIAASSDAASYGGWDLEDTDFSGRWTTGISRNTAVTELVRAITHLPFRRRGMPRPAFRQQAAP